ILRTLSAGSTGNSAGRRFRGARSPIGTDGPGVRCGSTVRADCRRAGVAPGRQRRQPGDDSERGGAAAFGRGPRTPRARDQWTSGGLSAMTTSTRSLNDIRAKVRASEPLSLEDGVALFQHPNLLEVAALANEVRERLHGDRTYFNRNFHINATNVCVASC